MTAEQNGNIAATHIYEDCPELREVDDIIENCFLKGDFATCFRRMMKLALTGYPLAECQVGWFYIHGYGAEANPRKARYWLKRALKHGDPDAEENLREINETGEL
ncbi:MAG: hypothetical protein LBN02_09065 [Oscillospiraceae bacterium]|jgi:TPR repeat protein|nr:hypothetical protein [Oscillospiraceae bacterium]